MARLLPSLPMDIVEHIQSYMNFKDAARSATVCGRLYDSWCKRKHIDLDETLFRDVGFFWDGAMKIIEMFRDGKLKLEPLTIRLSSGFEYYYPLIEVIDKAVSLGIAEISLHIHKPNINIHIPDSVFSSGQLVKLSVRGGTLEVGSESPVCSSSLKTLILLPDRYVGHVGDMLNNVVIKCPCLENLVCCGFMLWYDFGNLARRLHALESLTVEDINFHDNLFFADIVRLFPRLKSLSLLQINKCRDFHIRSATTERLTILDRYLHINAFVDVPNLQYFRYEGPPASSFLFKSIKHVWIADVTILCVLPDELWFSELHSLLRGLRNAKIYLTVKVVYDNADFTCDYAGNGSIVDVEMLAVKSVSYTPGLVDGLSCVCKPKIVCHDLVYNNAIEGFRT